MAKERDKIFPASYLILQKENKLLFIRRFNTGYDDGKYSLIAGHVDKGENFTQAIIREAEEEAGIIVKEEDLEVMHIMNRKNQWGEERVDAFFKAKKWENEPKIMESHKCDDMGWFDLKHLPENTQTFLLFMFENVKNKKFYSEYGW